MMTPDDFERVELWEACELHWAEIRLQHSLAHASNEWDRISVLAAHDIEVMRIELMASIARIYMVEKHRK